MSEVKRTHTRFEVFTTVTIQVEVVRVVTPCSAVVKYCHSIGPCCLHLHFILKMAAVRSSEMLLYYCSTTQHHNPEDIHLKKLVIMFCTKCMK